MLACAVRRALRWHGRDLDVACRDDARDRSQERRGGRAPFYTFPNEHWTKIRSTNPLERVNKEIGWRTDVVGIFPNDQAVIRLAGALLSEQNDEWLIQRRYLSVESMALTLAEPALLTAALLRFVAMRSG